MSEFLAMGGYAGYVWSAFAITAAVLVGNLFAARRRHAAMLETLRRRYCAGQPS